MNYWVSLSCLIFLSNTLTSSSKLSLLLSISCRVYHLSIVCFDLTLELLIGFSSALDFPKREVLRIFPAVEDRRLLLDFISLKGLRYGLLVLGAVWYWRLSMTKFLFSIMNYINKITVTCGIAWSSLQSRWASVKVYRFRCLYPLSVPSVDYTLPINQRSLFAFCWISIGFRLRETSTDRCLILWCFSMVMGGGTLRFARFLTPQGGFIEAVKVLSHRLRLKREDWEFWR